MHPKSHKIDSCFAANTFKHAIATYFEKKLFKKKPTRNTIQFFF